MLLPPSIFDASYPVPPLPLPQTKRVAVTKLVILADCGFLCAASKCPLEVHGRGSAPRKGGDFQMKRVQVEGLWRGHHTASRNIGRPERRSHRFERDEGGATSSGLRDLSKPSLARPSGATPASLTVLGSAPLALFPGRRCLRRLLGRASHGGADIGTKGGQGGDASAYGVPPPDAAWLHGDREHGEGYGCGGSKGATGFGPRNWGSYDGSYRSPFAFNAPASRLLSVKTTGGRLFYNSSVACT